jgi:hypothetical protein
MKCVAYPSASSLIREKALDIREEGYSFRLSNREQFHGLILPIMQILRMSLAPFLVYEAL